MRAHATVGDDRMRPGQRLGTDVLDVVEQDGFMRLLARRSV